MTVKKAYTEIVATLEANKDSLVGDVLPDIMAICTAKTGAGGGKASCFHRNEAGEVVAIKCYYHKLWMDPRVIDFGKKATSPTGLNNMCKDGVSKWTKQQREGKTAEGDMLQRVIDGDLEVGDIGAEKEALEASLTRIDAREDGYGFETMEECIADSEARGV